MTSNQSQGRQPRPGSERARLQGWLENPQRFLRLLVSTAAAHAGPLHRSSVDVQLEEQDVVSLIRLLAHVALAGQQAKDDTEAAAVAAFFRQRLEGLPAELVVAMERILSSMAGPGDRALPVQLASGLIRLMAAEAYRRGTLSPSGVQVLLGRMRSELATLQRALALAPPQSGDDPVEEEFWNALPEPDRRHVLLSADAWCVPPGALRRVVEGLGAEPEAAADLLEQYALCAHSAAEPARARAAQVLSELAELYASFEESLLESAIGHAGRQLARESRAEMLSVFAAAFTRLCQQAGHRGCFRALGQAVELLDMIERAQPLHGEELRTRVAVESRLPVFLRQALKGASLPRELAGLLRQVPQAAAQELNRAFEVCSLRAERERLVELAAAAGPVVAAHLREKLRADAPANALAVVGLLSRLDLRFLDELLPTRLARWSREHHDAVVRALAAGGAPERGQLLLRLLGSLDLLVVPSALDEIGLSGDRETAPRLMRLAGGTLPQSSEPYLRLKAVEALGRLRAPTAAPLLQQLVEAKMVWRWREPREIRIAAAQALRKIDPEWARKSLKRSGLTAAELAVAPLEPEPAVPWVRQRRYLRIPLASKLPTRVSSSRFPSGWPLLTEVLSLGGGLAETQNSAPQATEVELLLQTGLRPVRALARMRQPRPPQVGFEILSMELGERSRLRRLLASQLPAIA